MAEELKEKMMILSKEPYRLRRQNVEKSYPRHHSRKIKKSQDKEFEKITEEKNTIEGVQSDIDKLRDQLLRTSADFDNYRKRVLREREEIRKFATEELIKELLTVLDNFSRAVEASKLAKDFDNLSKGVEMIYQQIMNILMQKGLKKIEAKGEKFDPNYHEAVMVEENKKVDDQTVLEVLTEGYLLNDRVIKASVVKVSKKT